VTLEYIHYTLFIILLGCNMLMTITLKRLIIQVFTGLLCEVLLIFVTFTALVWGYCSSQHGTVHDVGSPAVGKVKFVLHDTVL